MILNSGLDAACTTPAIPGQGAGAHPAFGQWIEWAAFGTGSTAPAPTDTALASEVDRSNNYGGFNNVTTGGLDASNNLIWAEVTFTRVFTVSGNVNATEWGLAYTSSSALSVRDLFRADPLNPASSPITLTLEDGDELQLVVTLRVQADWQYAAKSFVITGTAGNDTTGTHTGQATVSSGSSSNTNEIIAALQAVWPGGYSLGQPSRLHLLSADQTSVSKAQNVTQDSAGDAVMTNGSYTPGDNFRDCTGVFSTSVGNTDHYAWLVAVGTQISAPFISRGYRFILTDPPFLTKENTHRLTLTVRKHISRL